MGKKTLKHDEKLAQSGIIYVLIWASLFLGSIGLTLLFANDSRNFRSLVMNLGDSVCTHCRSSGKEQVRATSRLVGRPNVILSPVTLGRMAPLRRKISVQSRCARLQRPGQDSPQLVVAGKSFQCTSLNYVQDVGARASVFFQIHINEAGDVVFFRVKFNLGSSNGREAVEIGLNSLKNFGYFVPEFEGSLKNVEQKILEWKSFSYLAGAHRIKFQGEYSDSTRFNLTGTILQESAHTPSIWPIGGR